MRTLIYTAFVSLDGVVDSPGGGDAETHRSAGWTLQDIEFLPDAYELEGHEQEEATAMMLGRMFSDTDKDKQMLNLVESDSYGNGIQKLVYDVVR